MNGRVSLFQWALGIALVVIMALFGVNFRLVTQRVDALEAQGSPAMRERVAALERALNSLQLGQDRLERQIERNSVKLDALLERTNGGRR